MDSVERKKSVEAIGYTEENWHFLISELRIIESEVSKLAEYRFCHSLFVLFPTAQTSLWLSF